MITKRQPAIEVALLAFALGAMVVTPIVFGNDGPGPLSLVLFAVAWILARALIIWLGSRRSSRQR